MGFVYLAAGENFRTTGVPVVRVKTSNEKTETRKGPGGSFNANFL